MGGTKWQEVWQKTQGTARRKSIVNLYTAELKNYYQYIEVLEMPVNSDSPDTYLIFTTRNETGRKIMSEIINAVRRKGSDDLTKWI